MWCSIRLNFWATYSLFRQLFLIHMNYLQHALKTLGLIMPTEDTNLLYSQRDKNTIFSIVNM